MGERIRKVKVWELMDWDNISLLGKAKAAQKKKQQKTKWNREFIPYFPWARRHSDTSRKEVLIAPNGFLGIQRPSPQMCPPFSFFSPSFIAEPDACGVGHPFGQSGPAVLAMTPPAPGAPPAWLLAGQHEKQINPCLCVRAALQQLKHHHYCHQKSKPKRHTILFEEN